MRPLDVRRLGRVPYQQAWDLQKDLVEQRFVGDIPDTLLLLEHDPVITLGSAGKRDSLLVDDTTLAARGIDLVHSDRGGDITWHGPGQIIGYAILDLRPDRKDVRRFVGGLEETVIRTCGHYGLHPDRLAGAPGVWLHDGPRGDRKIAAIGARFSRWISRHGFALNVNPNLAAFGLIVPCGLHGKGVTSLEAELGHPVPIGEVMDHLATQFAQVFEYDHPPPHG